MTEKVIVKDFDDIVEITYNDILKYHGRQMIGGAALAFKIMLMTFPKLSDEIRCSNGGTGFCNAPFLGNGQ